MDADKEGFLRSERSLIQTIGRAARNLNGRAILYADRITGSMQRAMDETDRRRTKQREHNKLNGITPTGIVKAIRNSIDDKQTEEREQRQYITKLAGEQAKYAALTPKQLAKRLQQMEQAMYRHAQNLEFEEAAAMRNEIEHVNFLGY